jgi:hypothetical protein
MRCFEGAPHSQNVVGSQMAEYSHCARRDFLSKDLSRRHKDFDSIPFVARFEIRFLEIQLFHLRKQWNWLMKSVAGHKECIGQRKDLYSLLRKCLIPFRILWPMRQ